MCLKIWDTFIHTLQSCFKRLFFWRSLEVSFCDLNLCLYHIGYITCGLCHLLCIGKIIYCFLWLSAVTFITVIFALSSRLHQASPHWHTYVSTPRSTMVRSGKKVRVASAAQPQAAYSSATCVASTARHPPSSKGTWAPIATTKALRAPSPLMWLPAALFPLATWWQRLLCTSPVTLWWTCSSQTALALQRLNPTVSSRELSNNNPSPLTEGKVREG